MNYAFYSRSNAGVKLEGILKPGDPITPGMAYDLEDPTFVLPNGMKWDQ
jgi:hypothetical protein